MSLILRGDKGQKLTIQELDQNFQYLESLIGTGGGGSTASFLYEGSLVLETLDEDKLFNNSTNYELPLTLTQSYNLKGMFLTQSFEFIQNIGEGGLTASFRIDTTMFNGFAELELEFGISLYAPITYQKLDYYVLETIEIFKEGLVVEFEEAPSNVFGDSNINPVYERFSLDIAIKKSGEDVVRKPYQFIKW